MGTDLYLQDGITPNFNRLNPSLTAPKLIGLSGYAQSGKDTVGKIITDLYGHEPISFSDKLREFLYEQDLYIPDEKGFAIRLNEVVDAIGWEDARRRYQYIRVLQQKTGTDAGRHLLGDTIWIDAAMSVMRPGGSYVFTSVRFPNEALRIVESGGIILRVERPGVEAVNDHGSDTALDDWDFDGYIENDGSLLDLQGTVMIALGEFQ